MLVVLRGARLAVELAADLVEELVEAAAIARGHGAHAAMSGIHGHDGSSSAEWGVSSVSSAVD